MKCCCFLLILPGMQRLKLPIAFCNAFFVLLIFFAFNRWIGKLCPNLGCNVCLCFHHMGISTLQLPAFFSFHVRFISSMKLASVSLRNQTLNFMPVIDHACVKAWSGWKRGDTNSKKSWKGDVKIIWDLKDDTIPRFFNRISIFFCWVISFF
jgi:hypothetical protein